MRAAQEDALRIWSVGKRVGNSNTVAPPNKKKKKNENWPGVECGGDPPGRRADRVHGAGGLAGGRIGWRDGRVADVDDIADGADGADGAAGSTIAAASATAAAWNGVELPDFVCFTTPDDRLPALPPHRQQYVTKRRSRCTHKRIAKKDTELDLM